MAIFSKKKKYDKQAQAKPDKPASMQELYGAKATVKTAGKEVKVKISPNSRAYRTLLKPLITEKASNLNSLQKYVFAVATDVNKISVMKAVEELYGVKPLRVNIINLEGKLKQRGRIAGRRKDWKKAIVTLPKGATIDVYEGV
jgi:large subunit ribosomal protein L23